MLPNLDHKLTWAYHEIPELADAKKVSLRTPPWTLRWIGWPRRAGPRLDLGDMRAPAESHRISAGWAGP